jgi:hypothetical protein
MRCHMAIATLALALLTAPLWAQMRGGARGAPVGRPGFASRGPVMASRGPMMAGRGGFISSSRGVRFGTNFRGQFFFRDRFFFDGFRHRRFFFAGFPFWWYGYPYYGAYSYPLFWDTSSSYDSSRAYSDETRQLSQQINRLSNEVEQLRREQEYRAPPPQPPVQLRPEAKSEPPRPTVLIFHDKHVREVKNYAIVGPTLWIFNEQRATKIPLSSLDLDATTKLNEERGVEFNLPK